ncbi:MAG: helix-turn-helix domain-containing protein [Eubacteriales bacterium]|nr:helix-turn-helix domain-containing protein [Eubacteriales bacterium]
MIKKFTLWIKTPKLNKASRQGIFLKFLLIFLVCILLPVLLLGALWYRDVNRTIRRQIIESEQRCLKQITEESARIQERIAQDLLSVLYGTSFQTYCSQGRPEDLVRLMKDFDWVKNSNSSLYSIYLYDSAEERIWDSASRIQDAEDFYDTTWLDMLEADVGIQILSSRRNMDSSFAENLSESLTLYYPEKAVLTVVTPVVSQARLAGNIDLGKLGGELESYLYNEGKSVYLLSEDAVFYKSSQAAELSEDLKNQAWSGDESFYEYWGGENVWFACRLGTSDLYYLETYKVSDLFASSAGYGNYVIRITFLLLVSLTILAVFVASRIYRPFDELYALSENPPADYDAHTEAQMLGRVYRSIEKNPEEEKRNQQRQNEFVSSSMLNMLFYGNISQETFLGRNQQFRTEDAADKRYRILLCYMRPSGQPMDETRNNRLREVINTYLTARLDGILTEVSQDSFAVLFAGSSEEHIAQTQVRLMEIFDELTECRNCFVASECFGADADIREQYLQCMNTLQNECFFLKEEDEVSLLEPKEEENPGYKNLLKYAPILIRSTVQGERETMTAVLSDLEAECNIYHSRKYAQNLCARILSEIDKELNLTAEGADPIRKVYETKTLPELIAYMNAVLERKIDRLQRDSQPSESKYYQEALTFIQENYAKNINVTDVANAVGISYVYLSKIFKAYHPGDTRMMDYLNDIRITKACDLLTQTNQTLNEIAEQVGYNNVQSFARYFKKYKGMTPGDYRKKQDL